MPNHGQFMLGDMMVIGHPPAKLLKALAVISKYLHPIFEADPRVEPGISRRSCILMSLTVRDFLHKVGFADARCQACAFTLYGFPIGSETQFHSVGMVPDSVGDGWPGHVVVLVDDWLIDTTLYQVQRPVWEGLAGMTAAPALTFPEAPLGADIRNEEKGIRLELTWAAIDRASWKSAPDAHRTRRQAAVSRLVDSMRGYRPIGGRPQ